MAKIKSLTGQNSSQRPLKLQTPVGTFWGDDILEGFAADAKFLGRHRSEPEIYDNEFYRLCKLEKAYIFDLKSSEEIKIPPMTLKRFEEILFSMKKGKACNIYQLTAEHLQTVAAGLNSLFSNSSIVSLSTSTISHALRSSLALELPFTKARGSPSTRAAPTGGSLCPPL